MSRTYKHQFKYKSKVLSKELDYIFKYYGFSINNYYLRPWCLNSKYFYMYLKYNFLIRITGFAIESHLKRTKDIYNKQVRSSLKQQTVKELDKAFNDLEDAYYDYLAYGNPSRDMYGQLINKTSDEYLYDVDPDWLEYLGLDLNWTLEDELDYCDKVFATYDPEEEYNFTEEEINYHRNSYKLSCEKNEIETDLIQRAMNAYQAVKDYQDAWRKYGSSSRVELYFGVTNEQEAQEWLEEFCKDIE